MANIITREVSGTGATVKGSSLTNAEIDNNFLTLKNAIATTEELVETTLGDVAAALDAINGV